MPDEAGLIVADRFGAEIVREAGGADDRPGDASRRDAALRHGGGGSAASAGGPGWGRFLTPPRLTPRY